MSKSIDVIKGTVLLDSEFYDHIDPIIEAESKALAEILDWNDIDEEAIIEILEQIAVLIQSVIFPPMDTNLAVTMIRRIYYAYACSYGHESSMLEH